MRTVKIFISPAWSLLLASGVVARLFPVHEWNEVENVDLRDINDDDAADQNGKSLALHRRIIASHRIGWEKKCGSKNASLYYILPR